MKKDDVLRCLWGFEQTNVSYFQVLSVSDKGRAKVQEIESKVLDYSSAEMRGSVVPIFNTFKKDSKPFTRKIVVSPYGDYIRIEDRSIASVKESVIIEDGSVWVSPDTFTTYG